MNYEVITAVAVNQILNILFMVLAYRFLRPRLKGDRGDNGCYGERGLDGKSAKEIAQLLHPEIVTDEDFINFLKESPALERNYRYKEELVDGESTSNDISRGWEETPRRTSQPHGTAP